MLIIELSSEKHALQNIQNDCYEGLSDSCRVHQIRFRPRLRPGPRWGSSRRYPRPPSRLGRGTPPPRSLPPRRLRRLGIVACSDSSSAPSAPRSQSPIRIFFWIRPCTLLFNGVSAGFVRRRRPVRRPPLTADKPRRRIARLSRTVDERTRILT